MANLKLVRRDKEVPIVRASSGDVWKRFDNMLIVPVNPVISKKDNTNEVTGHGPNTKGMCK